MRITLTIDDEVLNQARELAGKRGIPFHQLIDEALRADLAELAGSVVRRPYHTRPHSMGLRPGLNLDDTQMLLDQIEGDETR